MSAGPIEIRRAGPEDAAELGRLLHDFNAEFEVATPGVPALTKNGRRMLEAGEMSVLLAGDGPDGIALLRFRNPVWTGTLEPHLQELYVVPGLWGRGIGRAMLEATMVIALEEGATTIDLGIAERRGGAGPL